MQLTADGCGLGADPEAGADDGKAVRPERSSPRALASAARYQLEWAKEATMTQAQIIVLVGVVVG
ncbi:MAG TPA: hypothetical protein VK845_16320, partial [Gemmatimonadales bacterium]|nr:hypothetical protein [Gemmatimonadales bacterium]